MDTQSQNHLTLKIIAVLLFGNLCTEIYSAFIPPAHAQSTPGPVDCKIVDISSNIYNSLPVELEDIGNLSSSDKVPVQVVDWNTSDEVKVKVSDWDTSDTVRVRID